MNDEITARALDNLERCINLLKNQLLVKDEQIASLKKIMESTVFSIEAEI